jgi:hypothetical protein
MATVASEQQKKIDALETNLQIKTEDCDRLSNLLGTLLLACQVSPPSGDLATDVTKACENVRHLNKENERLFLENQEYKSDEIYTFRDRHGQRARISFSQSALLHAIAELAFKIFMGRSNTFGDIGDMISLLTERENAFFQGLDRIRNSSPRETDRDGKPVRVGDVVEVASVTGPWPKGTRGVVTSCAAGYARVLTLPGKVDGPPIIVLPLTELIYVEKGVP